MFYLFYFLCSSPNLADSPRDLTTFSHSIFFIDVPKILSIGTLLRTRRISALSFRQAWSTHRRRLFLAFSRYIRYDCLSRSFLWTLRSPVCSLLRHRTKTILHIFLSNIMKRFTELLSEKHNDKHPFYKAKVTNRESSTLKQLKGYGFLNLGEKSH